MIIIININLNENHITHVYILCIETNPIRLLLRAEDHDNWLVAAMRS